MSFLDKFKAGVAEASSKAKTLVEINRLKMANLAKQNEMNHQYQQIGQLAFEALEDGTWPPAADELELNARRIRELKREIEQNMQQIANLSDTKKCHACGGSVPVEARECPKCGQKFEIIDVTELSTERDLSAEQAVSDGEDTDRKDSLRKPEAQDVSDGEESRRQPEAQDVSDASDIRDIPAENERPAAPAAGTEAPERTSKE